MARRQFELVQQGVCGDLRRSQPITLALSAPLGTQQPEDLASWPACDPDCDPERLGPNYMLSDDVAIAINLALALGQPLLVTGEPGCGKTSLAYGAAIQLGVPYVWRFDTQSTTTADELFYRFDHVRRFHDASVMRDRSTLEAVNYVELQALGAALRAETTQVVLVDEIDKAPRDLPNDLLRAITEPMRFTVRETPGNPRVSQRARHLVVVTSNHERDLPEAFLRRCIYAHLRFPDRPETLVKIVQKHLGDELGVVEAAATRFLSIRKKLREAQPEGAVRLPGTSELIAWVRALRLLGRTVHDVSHAPLDARLGAGAVLKHWEEFAALGVLVAGA